MKKFNFLHFVTDEKFIRDEIVCFEEARLTNNAYYYVGDSNRKFEFISNEIVRCISKDCIDDLFKNETVDAVCLHNLYSLPYESIIAIPKNIAVIWYAWGFDLYSNPLPLGPLLNIGERYMTETLKFSKKNTFRSCLKTIAKKILKICINNDVQRLSMAQSAISRIDYFAGVFESEYELLKGTIPFFRAQKIIHNYIHPQEFRLTDISTQPKIEGNNILLGNSASMYGNHIDIMNQIAPYIDKESKIICPLSYAGSPSYIKAVMKHGTQLFGEQFVPLNKYLSLSEYTKVMRSCNRFVMGMLQQAATCNCLTSIWDGIKIYAPQNSMNYVHYNSIGIKLYSIEEDFGREIDPQYSNLAKNREIVESTYSYRRWCIDLEESISIIFNRT